jgi:vancomycin resistance protein YoaR
MSNKKNSKQRLKELKKADQKIKRERGGKSRKKSRKVLFGIAGGIAACLLLGYVSLAVYYHDRFYPGTVINDNSFGGKKVEDVKEILKKSSKDYVLTIKEKEDKTELISGEAIKLQYKDDRELDEVKEKQNSWLWPIQIFQDKIYMVSMEHSYDEASFTQVVNQLACMQDANMTPPQDARLEDDDTAYQIVPEVEGTALDKEKTTEVIKKAVDERRTEVSLTDEDCYLKPTVLQSDEELAKEAEKLNKITATQITVNFGNGTETVTRDMLKSWLVKGEDGTYTFDVNLVKPVVIGWSEKYNTYGKPRDFKTSGGGTVRLTTGDYGWRVWQDKTTDALIAALNAGQSGELEPTWLYKGQTHEGNDINGTYVEISIDQQRMWFYKNGTCLVDTPVVTGNPNKGHGTPKGGVWRLKDKASPFTLVGKKPDGSIDYEEPVNYWMPFNGGVGIHDLTKRSSFGGDIYLTNGSHGCINTPLDNVRTIYENIEVNTPIVVY